MDSAKQNRKEKRQKILSWVSTVICILFLVLAIFLCSVNFLANRDKKGAVDIFGYSFSLVQTDSMAPEIGVGELITVKKCSIAEAVTGKNAVFIATEGELAGRQIVHKVIRTGSDENGEYIVTQGLKEGAVEDKPVYASTFVGLAVKHSAGWGKIAKFFTDPVNWVLIFVVLVGIPVVFTFTKMVVRFSSDAKKEKKQSELQEREKLKAELLEEYRKSEEQPHDDQGAS